MIDANYEWFMKHDLNNYAGKWIAVCEDKVVASGDDAGVVMKDAKKKCKGKVSTLTKVPKKDQVLIL